MEGVGEEQLSRVISDVPILGEMVAGFVGLIPNCASSVVVTELYLQNVIGAGPMMAGLFVNAGVGVLILCRMNTQRIKQNVGIIAYLYLTGVIGGILVDFFVKF